MRQRKIKGLDEKLEKVNENLVLEAKQFRGQWKNVFANENPIFVEFGSGKGKFILEHAMETQDKNYIAIEGQASVAIRILEKIKEKELTNVKVIIDFISDIKEYFAENEISGMYLNFSDPWPKSRHAKRRLTYIENLKAYNLIMKKGSFLEIKTDNDGLYEFSLEQVELAGLELCEKSEDLHASEYEAKRIKTEYEGKFSEQGKNINYIKARML